MGGEGVASMHCIHGSWQFGSSSMGTGFGISLLAPRCPPSLLPCTQAFLLLFGMEKKLQGREHSL